MVIHLEEVAADPEVITHVDALSGPHLVLPLGRHPLGIGSRYPYTSVETGSVMGLYNIPAKDIASTDCAIVGALGSREAILGPSEGVTILAQKSVLLFNACVLSM